jgi:hypothetical protein
MLNTAPSSEGAGLNTTPHEGLTMSKSRFYVALGEDGRPAYQRNTVKEKPYLSAKKGGSFSSYPRSSQYPLRVVEVPKAIEWVGRATLPDGTKVTDRSKSCPVGRNFIRFSYIHNVHGDGERKRVTHDAWTSLSEAEFTKSYRRDERLAYELVAFVPAEIEVRNWPEPGDSIVLK